MSNREIFSLTATWSQISRTVICMLADRNRKFALGCLYLTWYYLLTVERRKSLIKLQSIITKILFLFYKN